MTGDQSVIKSRVAMGQKPFFQATCPRPTLLQNNIMCVDFVLFVMMLLSRKEKKISLVLTGVNTPGKNWEGEEKHSDTSQN